MRRFLLVVWNIYLIGTSNVHAQCDFPLSLNDKVEARFIADFFEASASDTSAYEQWTDLSGNGNHFLSSTDLDNKPIYLPDTLNGRGALFLNGNDQMTIGNELIIGAAFTIFSWDGELPFNDFKGLLTRPTGPGNYRLFLGQNEEFSFWPNGFFGTDAIINNVDTMDISNEDTFNCTYAFRSDPEVMNQLLLGRDFSAGNRFWEGKMVELILFNESLSEVQLEQLKQYVICTYTPIPEVPTVITTSDFCPIELNFERDYFKAYNWSTGANTSSIEVNQSGIYSVELVTIFNDTLIVEVEVEFPGNFINDFALCVGQDSLWAPELEGFDLVWQDGSESSDYLITDEGAYWLHVADTSGCFFSSDTVFVQEDFFSEELDITYAPPFCAGNSLTLNFSSEEVVSYSWSTGSQDPTIVPEDGGQFWVMAENINGCVGSDTVEVDFAGISPLTQFASDPLCEQTAIQFTDQSEVLDDSEITGNQWIINNDTLEGETVDYTFAEIGSYSIQLNVFTDVGCTGKLEDVLEIHPLPDVAFDYGLPCSGQFTLFEDQSSIVEGNLSTWNWDFGDGNTANTPSATNVFDAPGGNVISLTVTSVESCATSLEDTISVHPSPEATFTWTPTCQGNSMTLQSTTDTSLTGSLNYAWNMSGVAAPGHTVQHEFSGAGDFQVSFEVWTTIDGSAGCFDEQEQTVSVSTQPTIQFQHSPACTGQEFSLTDQSQAGNNDSITNWHWSIAGELIDSTSVVSWVFDEVGEYPVMVSINTAAGCHGQLTQTILVGSSEPPIIGNNPEIGMPPVTVQFFNENNYGQSYFWSFGDGGTSDEESPEYTYQDTGVYEVELMVHDDAGCTGFDSATFLAIPPYFDVSIEDVNCDIGNNQLSASCVIGNYNNHRLTSADISISLGNGTVVTETWSGDLARNQLATYTFQSQLNVEPEVNDSYLCVEISNPNGSIIDAFPANNRMCKSFSTETFEVFNPYPNPAFDRVQQGFHLQREGTVIIRLVQSDGRVLLEQERDYPAGLNFIELETGSLSAGVYFISLEWNGNAERQKIMVRK